jgi:hypothetical protein
MTKLKWQDSLIDPRVRGQITEAQRAQGYWDEPSGICPWGHDIKLCMRKYFDRKRGSYTRVCRIRKRENSDARRLAEGKTIKDNAMPAWLGTTFDRLRKTGATMVFDGPVIERYDDHYEVTLVCGHTCLHLKVNLDVRYYDRPLYCVRCDDWKKIHLVSNDIGDMKSLRVYPLESSIGV